MGRRVSSSGRGLARSALQKVSEEWRPVVGWEGYYEVSDLGRVRSVTRQVRCRAGTRLHPGRVLRLKKHPFGYGMCALSMDGAVTDRLVHHMVLEAFVGPRPAGLNGLHNDGDPSNSRLTNLRWDTQAANIADAMAHGTWSPPPKNGRDLLTGRFIAA